VYEHEIATIIMLRILVVNSECYKKINGSTYFVSGRTSSIKNWNIETSITDLEDIQRRANFKKSILFCHTRGHILKNSVQGSMSPPPSNPPLLETKL